MLCSLLFLFFFALLPLKSTFNISQGDNLVFHKLFPRLYTNDFDYDWLTSLHVK